MRRCERDRSLIREPMPMNRGGRALRGVSAGEVLHRFVLIDALAIIHHGATASHKIVSSAKVNSSEKVVRTVLLP